ncbi:MAG: hypothetical protein U9Q29_06210 [Campylobacterota bacterium]|nr:hypothetical protein [Campylobacterota bacterium]
MQNPFESGQIKNYIFLYVSVVVIMILFFIASMLFNDVKEVEKKVFKEGVNQTSYAKKEVENLQEKKITKFKLLDKAY